MGSLDLWVFHLINGWSGYPLFDWIAGFADRIELLKAGILVSIYWCVIAHPGVTTPPWALDHLAGK